MVRVTFEPYALLEFRSSPFVPLGVGYSSRRFGPVGASRSICMSIVHGSLRSRTIS